MPPLRLQILVVPAVDARWVPLEGSCEDDVPYQTYKTCEYAPCLPLARMRWFSKLWIGTDLGELSIPTKLGHSYSHLTEERKKKASSWLASPILAPSHANLAPCSIHCAEWDVLRDEAIAYNELLTKSGTSSRIRVYQGVCHPWGHWDGELEKAKDYVRSTCADLRKAHAVTSS